jgi:hypothetical protein
LTTPCTRATHRQDVPKTLKEKNLQTKNNASRFSYFFLCVAPVIAIVAMARGFRIPGVYQTVGLVLFAAIVIAAWVLGARVILSGSEARRMLGVTGALLIVPFALVALLWVGLATPWHATPPENVMRYLVLLASSIAVASAFVVLKEVLAEAGERFYSTLGFAANILAGAGYVIWTSFQAGFHVLRVADGEVLPAIASMNSVNDILLFAACALTYAATAAFAASLGRVGWLGRGATRAYVIVSVVLLAFLVMRGVSFPNPAASTMRWYMFPGFVAGIPAIPWLMPFFLGVVLLRRAGYGESVTERV